MTISLNHISHLLPFTDMSWCGSS